ncbi:MAG TPA: hypothetical protein VKR27_07915, partial [Acidimicrobiales bacterium]|nr:hypothetical protein [Acidimicrobiales bacterium]
SDGFRIAIGERRSPSTVHVDVDESWYDCAASQIDALFGGQRSRHLFFDDVSDPIVSDPN